MMGFFKKLFKGVKKVFKKIGKGIKKAVGKVGKFMGKLGIVGQIGLGLLLPGIGSMMGSMFSGLAGSLATSSIGIVRGAGQVINAAINIGTKAGNVFSSITEGVTKVVGDLAGATLNKLGVKNIGTIDLSSKTFSGAWETTQNAISDVAASGRDLFSMDTLTGANKYLTQSAVDAGEAALAGTDTASTYTDAMLEDLPETIQPYKDPLKVSVPEGTLGDAVEGFRAAQEVSAPAVDYSTFDPATGGTFIDSTAQAATTQAVTTTQPSLLSRAKTGAIERTRAAIAGAPEQFVKTGVANLAAIPRDIVKSAMAPTPEVTYNVRQSAIPDIGFAGIGSEFAQPSFDPVSYFDQNQAAFTQAPFGFGARMYSEASYARNMQGYGFQVPMYGIS